MAAKLVYKGHLPVTDHSLNEMTAVAHLYGPWKSNDYGRWAELHNAAVDIPGLPRKAATQAINQLIERGIISRRTIDNHDIYELAGAYSYKGSVAGAAKRKVAELMHPSTISPDDTPVDRIEVTRNVIHHKHSTVEVGTPPAYFNILAGRGNKRNKLLIQPPAKADPKLLRLVSPHNVYLGLSPLGCCIRLMMEMTTDDLGRTVVSIEDLCRRLGRKIMTRTSKSAIRAEIDLIAEQGHLRLFEDTEREYVYVRDAAQHAMRKKRLTPKLPFLYPESLDWTLDTKLNLLFHARNHKAAARNIMVYSGHSYQDRAGTRLNAVYRSMGHYYDRLETTIKELSNRPDRSVADIVGTAQDYNINRTIRFFMAVEHDMEERALEIYYDDVCGAAAAGDPPQLTTLDTESAGGDMLVPALFEMRYGCSLSDYLTEKEAKWLPVWRSMTEEPHGLGMFNAVKDVQRHALQTAGGGANGA